MGKFHKMSYRNQLEFVASRRITVGKITQYEDRKFIDYFVGKIGGEIMSEGEGLRWKFPTPQEARDMAERVRLDAKNILKNLPS